MKLGNMLISQVGSIIVKFKMVYQCYTWWPELQVSKWVNFTPARASYTLWLGYSFWVMTEYRVTFM